MSDVARVACVWFHLIVLVVWIGHMVNALILFGPLSRKYIGRANYGDFIAEYRKRDTPVSLGSIAVFFITGFFLMFLNEHYEGIGNIFANSWTTVLFVKHILILAMVGLGVYQGRKVMPELARVSRQLADQSSRGRETASSFESWEKRRTRVTQALSGLAFVVLLFSAIGEIR
jgi:uncharacterized membrane protein